MLPHVLLLTAVVIWGWTFVATKVLVAELGPVEVFGLRLAIGLPFLGAVLLVKRVPLRFTRQDARALLFGGAVFALHFLVQIAGLEMTTATNTAWIVAASPLALAGVAERTAFVEHAVHHDCHLLPRHVSLPSVAARRICERSQSPTSRGVIVGAHGSTSMSHLPGWRMP